MSLDLDALRLRVFDIIKEADLDTCSAKSIRKQLEEELETDLSGYKEKISELINDAIMQRLRSNEQNNSKLESPGDKKKPDDHGELDEELDDEELARRLQEAENAKGRPSRRAASKVKGKRLIRKEGVKRKAPNNPFNKEFLLSEPLSKLVGAKQMSRPQVVKHIWAYVKERNLQDPSDRRILICDELMLPVLKKPKISCFAMNKVLSDHLIRMEDTVSAGVKRAKADMVESDSLDEIDFSEDDED